MHREKYSDLPLVFLSAIPAGPTDDELMTGKKFFK